MPTEARLHRSHLPVLPHWLLRALLPRAERTEVLQDLSVEFVNHAAAHGHASARRWFWRQAVASVPALLGWTWWRGWTGFQPGANAYRPGGPMFKYLAADIKYAVRRLRHRPSYSLLAILPLALGIGGTAAVFGVARPLILDPLP